MKILLLGDYSNVHATLAEGLRTLGHTVVLASDGDGWKDYPRDIDLKRPGKVGTHTLWQRVLDVVYYLKLLRLFHTKFRGYDIVQIINPIFLPLRAERIWPFYEKLRKYNAKVYMAAYGMDHFWVKAGLDCTTFRYSDFNIGNEIRTDLPENKIFIRDWLNGPKGVLNNRIVDDCDGIPAGLYEYWASYNKYLPEEYRGKLSYIPFPIKDKHPEENETLRINLDPEPERIRFFIGVQRSRNAYKGTDIMLRALDRISLDFPDKVDVRKVENVPFEEYKLLMDTSDVILDQLYSYTPAMNALQAMSQGLVVIGGAEPEYYDLQGSETLRPIFNVEPNEESVYNVLKWLVLHKFHIPVLKHQTLQFIRAYHDHLKVAQQYLNFWQC